MIVCGLDQAVKGSGWCVGDGSSKPVYGYQEFDDWGDNEARLSVQVYDWFMRLGKQYSVQAVCTESILASVRSTNRPQRRQGAQVLVDIPTIIKQASVVGGIALACAHLGIIDHHYQCAPSEWRSLITGITRAPKHAPDGWLKQQAINAVEMRGWFVDTHHVAEAICIWEWLLCKLDRNYRTRIGPTQRRSITSLQTSSAI